jgi:hypothetical protein
MTKGRKGLILLGTTFLLFIPYKVGTQNLSAKPGHEEFMSVPNAQIRGQDSSRTFLHYYPSRAHLTGTLKTAEAYGPPGFGEDPKHDEVEKYYVLVLENGINIEASEDEDSNDQDTFTDVKQVQVFLLHNVHGPISKLVNKRVRVEGTLHEHLTPAEHLDVIMDVKAIALVNQGDKK